MLLYRIAAVESYRGPSIDCQIIHAPCCKSCKYETVVSSCCDIDLFKCDILC